MFLLIWTTEMRGFINVIRDENEVNVVFEALKINAVVEL